jgi:5-methylcytosine-specific restriction protein A
MSLADLTPEAVRQAIAKFDRLGRREFLTRYGFGQARDYILIYNGHSYDNKAIAGVAHQFVPNGRVLMPHEFSGGKSS